MGLSVSYTKHVCAQVYDFWSCIDIIRNLTVTCGSMVQQPKVRPDAVVRSYLVVMHDAIRLFHPGTAWYHVCINVSMQLHYKSHVTKQRVSKLKLVCSQQT